MAYRRKFMGKVEGPNQISKNKAVFEGVFGLFPADGAPAVKGKFTVIETPDGNLIPPVKAVNQSTPLLDASESKQGVIFQSKQKPVIETGKGETFIPGGINLTTLKSLISESPDSNSIVKTATSASLTPETYHPDSTGQVAANKEFTFHPPVGTTLLNKDKQI